MKVALIVLYVFYETEVVLDFEVGARGMSKKRYKPRFIIRGDKLQFQEIETKAKELYTDLVTSLPENLREGGVVPHPIKVGGDEGLEIQVEQ